MATAEDTISKLIENGIKLLCIDFDNTILDMHTGGMWEDYAEDLVPHVRPVFIELFGAALAGGLQVAVVTFSGQQTLIREVLALAMPQLDLSSIVLRCSDGSWKASPGLSRKQAHIDSVLQELESRNGERVSDEAIVLVDDDGSNVERALECGMQGVTFLPSSLGEASLFFSLSEVTATVRDGKVGAAVNPMAIGRGGNNSDEWDFDERPVLPSFNDVVSSGEDAVSELMANGIKLLCVDFDHTIIDIHTWGRWEESAEALVPHVRPVFIELFQAAITGGLQVAVVTFSGQQALIRQVLALAMPTLDLSSVVFRCSDGAWDAAPGLSRKQAHIGSVLDELEGRNRERVPDEAVVLVDDDTANVALAVESGMQGVPFIPSSAGAARLFPTLAGVTATRPLHPHGGDADRSSKHVQFSSGTKEGAGDAVTVASVRPRNPMAMALGAELGAFKSSAVLRKTTTTVTRSDGTRYQEVVNDDGSIQKVEIEAVAMCGACNRLKSLCSCGANASGLCGSDGALDAGVTPSFSSFNEEARTHLEDNGYVVINDVMDADQLIHARELMWQFLETRCPDIVRNDPATWETPRWPAQPSNGIVSAGGQSQVSWFTRVLPKVRETFAALWRDDNLLCSFDTFNVFRPWHNKPELKTMGGWFHVDQNWARLPNMECVQGLVTLLDADSTTGGLTVIPASHKEFEPIAQRMGVSAGRGHFIPIDVRDPVRKLPIKLVTARAGSLLLWDSRTVHCNMPAVEGPRQPPEGELLRMVVYVCMTPRSKATHDVLRQRASAYESNASTSHWPHLLHLSGAMPGDQKLQEASEEVRRLVVGDESSKCVVT